MITHLKYSQLYKVITLLIFFFFNSTTLSAQTKMQSGSWSVSPSLNNYSLDTNNGERSMTVEIKFVEKFDRKPEVVLAVSQLDASNKTNARYNVEAISVSRDGFTLIVKTWADSKIFSISGNWIAYSN